MKNLIAVDRDVLAVACISPQQAEQRGWDTLQAIKQMGDAQATLRQHMEKTGEHQATGLILMPRELTAENGGKALMLGEFKESIELQCPCVHGEESDDDCKLCDGDGTYLQEVTISWPMIKDIYEKAVGHFGLPADLAPSSVGSSLTLNGHQLREALGFLAPDGSEEQLDQELVLYTGSDTFESKPIVYAHYEDCPEEGITVIDGDSELGLAFVPAGEVSGAVQGKVLVPKDSINLLFQGGCDATVEAFRVNGQMCIPSAAGATYLTREQASDFFGLHFSPQPPAPKLSRAVEELLRVDAIGIRTSTAFNRSMDELRAIFMSQQVDQAPVGNDPLSAGTPPGE